MGSGCRVSEAAEGVFGEKFGINDINMDKNRNNKIDIDPQIKSDYDLIMKDCPKIISSQWEMVGENYKQFSLYNTYYETKVSNCIEL